MPLYEYKCEGCGDVFEIIQRFSDEPLTSHDKCGGPVHRLLSPPALQFKGSGWYITDYAKSSKASENGSKKDGEKASSGESKSSASSDSASASSATTKSDTSSSTK